jgi:hypothetical protein
VTAQAVPQQYDQAIPDDIFSPPSPLTKRSESESDDTLDKISTGPRDITVRLNSTFTEAVLSWSNPLQEDFSKIKILRTIGGPARTPDDGIEIYNGNKEMISDTGIRPGVNYFYTFFALYENGGSANPVYVRMDTFQSELGEVRYTDGDFTLYDFDLLQYGLQIRLRGDTFSVDPGAEVEVRYDAFRMFEVIEGLSLQAVVYDKTGTLVHTLYAPFAFDFEKTLYRATFYPELPGSTILLKLTKRGESEQYVVARVEVADVTSQSEPATSGACALNFSNFFDDYKATIRCAWPWTLITAVLLLGMSLMLTRRVLNRT